MDRVYAGHTPRLAHWLAALALCLIGGAFRAALCSHSNCDAG
jgi:hypothetical protein